MREASLLRCCPPFTGNLETHASLKSLLGSLDSGVDVEGCTLSDGSEFLPVCYLGVVLSERIDVPSGVDDSLGLVILHNNEQSGLAMCGC